MTRPEPLKPLPSVARQRFIVGDALGEEQSLDPIDVLDPFGCQRLAFTADPATILLLWGRCSNHGADPRLASLICQQRAHQGLTVDLVGLRPSAPSRRRN